jgi:hypothetical protein
MLIAELFRNGTMAMGPSRNDPNRLVGVFAPGVLSAATEARARAMESFRWIEGEWSYENEVPATCFNPAYTDTGSGRFVLGEGGTWVCAVSGEGREYPQITFDPLSNQWIYLLTRGSYGLLRSPDGWQRDSIAFSGLMTMLGIELEWKMTWIKESRDRFRFINEEREGNEGWKFIDEWRYRRV